MLKANFDDHYAVLSEALPDYTICRPDADGTQGLLLQAIHNSSQRLVAIKVLLAGPLASREQQDRFRREIEILFDFQHPNIVPTYDCGSVAGRLYYVMQYINGLSVTDWALAYDPTPTRCVELFLEVCDGLSYAHRRGVIHRDVKPTNLLVDDAEGEAFGRPYIVDFGLAKKVLSEDDGRCPQFQTRADQILGTLPYMSPEHFDGREEIPDVRSDLYSLGVVFFQVLSGGEFPYPVDVPPEQIADNILHRAPGPLSVANPAVDPDLSSIVGKCLEKDSELRYRSIDDLADDLRRWQRGEAVAARQHHRWYRWKKAARLHKWGVAVAVVVCCMAGVSTYMWQRAEDLAVSYSTALKMGSLAKMGSVARDEDRTTDALTLWQHALDLAAAAPVPHEEVDSMRYAVLHQLAEFHLVNKNPDVSRGYCADAIAVAERYADDDDRAWHRRLGFAEILRGRLALADKDYEAALAAFSQAVEIRREFVVDDENNVSHKVDLGMALSLQGRAARELGRMGEAFEAYTSAYGIRLALHEDDPQSPDHAVELVHSESKLAVWHIVQKTPEHNIKAIEWIDRAEARLSEMLANSLCDDRPRDCRRLANDLTKNRALVNRRLHAAP